MTQNIYDDSAFFDNYAKLKRSVEGLDGAPEWPSLLALLPKMAGLSVVDLGCGYGWFCRWASGHGAAAVLGLDVSEKMLAHARASTADGMVTYVRADLECFELPENRFDLAYSSLAFHYIQNLQGLFATLHRVLKPGGRLVFSIEHPVFMASLRPDWIVDADGVKHWPVDNYQKEGPRTTDWLAQGVVKQHRTLGTLLNTLIASGFTIDHVEDWGPTAGQICDWPELAEEKERPMLLLVAAHR